MHVCGIVLAAGAGTRFGFPKGLAVTADGEPWVARAVRTMRAGGCDTVVVVVGARSSEVAALVPGDAAVVHAEGWSAGLSASLRTGLAAASDIVCDAAVVMPVDTPDASPAAVARVLGALGPDPARGLAQAVYRGEPGHPVAFGAAHLLAAASEVSGDRGARAYLMAYGAVAVECADLWSGTDQDTPPPPPRPYTA